MKERVCIVTGAGSGIGEATSLRLAAEGAVPVLVGRIEAKLESVRRQIQTLGGVATVIAADVTKHEEVRQLADRTLRHHGRIDALVNNAGFSSPNRTTLSLTPEEADAVIKVNLIGPMFLTQAVLPAMLEAGDGTIVNVSAGAGNAPSLISGPIYSAAKAGILNYTKYLNLELRNTGVRACSVIPGEVDTPILDLRPVPPSDEARATMLTADDVADTIMLAVTAPQRSLIEEIVIRPRNRRDYSAEITPAF